MALRKLPSLLPHGLNRNFGKPMNIQHCTDHFCIHQQCFLRAHKLFSIIVARNLKPCRLLPKASSHSGDVLPLGSKAEKLLFFGHAMTACAVSNRKTFICKHMHICHACDNASSKTALEGAASIVAARAAFCEDLPATRSVPAGNEHTSAPPNCWA